jgi:hypothetical protein
LVETVEVDPQRLAGHHVPFERLLLDSGSPAAARSGFIRKYARY